MTVYLLQYILINRLTKSCWNGKNMAKLTHGNWRNQFANVFIARIKEHNKRSTIQLNYRIPLTDDSFYRHDTVVDILKGFHVVFAYDCRLVEIKPSEIDFFRSKVIVRDDIYIEEDIFDLGAN